MTTALLCQPVGAVCAAVHGARGRFAYGLNHVPFPHAELEQAQNVCPKKKKAAEVCRTAAAAAVAHGVRQCVVAKPSGIQAPPVPTITAHSMMHA